MRFMDGVFLINQSSEWLPILFSVSLKSIVIVATAALLDLILRAASSRLRHILWCAALFGLLALPLFTGWLQPLDVPVLPAGLFPNELATHQAASNFIEESPGRALTAVPLDSGYQATQSAESTRLLVDEQRPSSAFSWPSIILLVWLIGVLLVFGRFLVGVVSVRRLVARATELSGAEWADLKSELSQQLQLRRRVRLLRSDESVMPMACAEIASAAVLLPKEADRWPADRSHVVVLHELIHIKRRDLLIQMLSQVVCALYWFNPLVWWAAQKLRIEQELACDEHVVASGVEASDYATHLLGIARSFHAGRVSAVSTTAMARSSQLQERLCAILRPAERYRSGRMITVSAVVMSGVFLSTAVTRLVTAERQSEISFSSVIADVIPAQQEQGEALPGGRKAFVTDVPATLDSGDDHARPTPSPTPANNPVNRPPDSPSDQPVTSPEPNEQTAEQIFDGFSAEDRTRLISNGIGPAYIEEMATAGYRQLNVDQLIQLFSNSVRADYVAGLRSVGYDHVSIRDLLSLKTNGVTPAVIKSYQAVKHASIEAKRYVALLSNDVTPSYWRSLADTGYDSLSANKAIELRLAGITSDFIVDARSRGYVNLSPNDLIELKRREK
jgi:beta-lactamase regulating signal transducer with metallopeptidase domain